MSTGYTSPMPRRLLRALELWDQGDTWDEIAATPLTPDDPTPLYESAAAAEAAVTAELERLRAELATLRVPDLDPSNDLAVVLAQLEAHGLEPDAVSTYLYLRTRPDGDGEPTAEERRQHRRDDRP